MPALQVKDFPGDLYEDLRKCAAAHDRNISQQTIHVLRDYLHVFKQGRTIEEWPGAASEASHRKGGVDPSAAQACNERLERRKKVFERIHALPPVDIPEDFLEPAELVRRMREERDDQIVPELRHVR